MKLTYVRCLVCIVTRKRAEKFIQIKVLAAHSKLQEKLQYLSGFRKQHEQLRIMTGPTKGLKGIGGDALTDIDMEEEVKIAVGGKHLLPCSSTLS
jgi:hypothetical protein